MTTQDQPFKLESEGQAADDNRINAIARIAHLSGIDLHSKDEEFRNKLDLEMWERWYKDYPKDYEIDEEWCQRAGKVSMILEETEKEWRGKSTASKLVDAYKHYKNKEEDMVKVQGNKGMFLSAEDVIDGDTVTILDGGEYVDGQWGRKLELNVKLNGGETKKVSLNATSEENLLLKWGNESDNWANKVATVEKVKQNVKGELKDVLYFTPGKDVIKEKVEDPVGEKQQTVWEEEEEEITHVDSDA